MKTRKYNIHDTLDFGKYRGLTIQEVSNRDPGYLDWCKREIDGFSVVNDSVCYRSSLIDDSLSRNEYSGKRVRFNSFQNYAKRFAEDAEIIVDNTRDCNDCYRL